MASVIPSFAGVRVSDIQERLGIKDSARKTRAVQRAVYKQKLVETRVAKEFSDAFRANPKQYGCPRAFKILIAGKEVLGQGKMHDRSFYVDEGHGIYFSAFGVAQRYIKLDDTWVKPQHVHLSADKTFYSIVLPQKNEERLSMYLDFTLPNQPTGFLALSNGAGYALMLDPEPVTYNVNASATAGAAKTDNTLTWDVTSAAWNSAQWEENGMSFSFDTVAEKGDFDDWEYYNECSFTDLLSGDKQVLDAADRGGFSCLMTETTPADIACNVVVTDNALIPQAPPERAGKDVKCVFPMKALFKFDEIGVNFTGAYLLENNEDVYAVTGSWMEAGDPGEDGRVKRERSHAVFQSRVEPMMDPFHPAVGHEAKPAPATVGNLDVLGLMSLNPVVPDDDSPTRMRDMVQSIADQDFHNIIVYYMDDDIRKVFVQSTPFTLTDETVKAIAQDNPEENKGFYKSLQTPYAAAILANWTQIPQGRECNGLRASAMLKEMPARSPVYKRHIDALYQYRFRCQFPVMQNYLDDQDTHDYSDQMRRAAQAMKDRIATAAADLVAQGGDAGTEAQKNIKTAQDEIDQLCAWAVDKKLYWAFRLYDHLVTVYLPSLYAQIMDGTMSAKVSQMMKAHSSVLGLLERNSQNENEQADGSAGPTLTRAWQTMALNFNVATTMSQFMDVDSHAAYFTHILKGSLTTFGDKHAGSADPRVAKAAERASALAADDTTRSRFWWTFLTSLRMRAQASSQSPSSSPAPDWRALVDRFWKLLKEATWYQALAQAGDADEAEGLATLFLRFVCAGILAFPMVARSPGGWKKVPDKTRSALLASAAGMALTFVIKEDTAAGIRVESLWSDVGALTPHFKALFGFGELVNQAPATGMAIAYGIVAYYNRNGPTTMMAPQPQQSHPTGAGTQAQRQSGLDVPLPWLWQATLNLMETNTLACIRIGSFALIGYILLFLGAFALNNGIEYGDPLSLAAGAVWLVAGACLIVAAGANWLMSIGAWVAGSTAAIMTSAIFWPAAVIGAALAIVGLVLALVDVFVKHHNPLDTVTDFLNKDCAKAGLKMVNETEVDYFNVVPADDQRSSLNGISIGVQDDGPYLQLGDPVTSTTEQDAFAAQTVQSVTYLPDTCWSLYTESDGSTTISTDATTSDGTKISVCLTCTEGGDALCAAPVFSKYTLGPDGKPIEKDPAVYQAEIARQQWKVTAVSKAKMQTRTAATGDGDGDEATTTTYAVQADFEIRDTNGSKKLVFQEGDNKLALVSDDTKTKTKTGTKTKSKWTLTLQPMGPPAFAYANATWTLTTQSRGESYVPYFSGSATLPMTWSVTPALPAFLRLAEARASGGTIEQVDGAAPAVMPATLYVVAANIVIGGQTFENSVRLTIRVEDPNGGPPSDDTGGVAALGSRTAEETETTTKEHHDAPSWVATLPSSSPDNPTDDYKAFMATAPAFFQWQQENPMTLSAHWTGQSAVSRMQNSVTGHWDEGGKDYKALYFPSPMVGPPLTLKEGSRTEDYNKGVNAYLAMAIQSGDSYCTNMVKVKKAQDDIDAFIAALLSHIADRFQEWVEWDGSVAVTGAHCTKDEYIACLIKSPWMRMRIFMMASGGWSNPSLEMFCHFMKLAALGCSDDGELTAVYNALTVGEPGKVLNKDWFPEITPTDWRSYRAFILAGQDNRKIPVSQLGVQNLGKTQHRSVFSAGTVVTETYHADSMFLYAAGYYQTPSGCCLEAGSRVLMGPKGKTLKPIGEVGPGDTVMGVAADGKTRVKRKVAFVSRPHRNGRALYAYRRAPGVLFTGDHPILLGCRAGDEEDADAAPVLGFVDVQSALGINPLWAAYDLETIPREDLVLVKPAQEHDVLFDLVFDNDDDGKESGIPNYIVRSGKDEEVVICSEAPDPAALPCMTRFVLAFTDAIAATSGDEDVWKHFFPGGLAAGAIDYGARIRRLRDTCAAQAVARLEKHHHRQPSSSPGSETNTRMAHALGILTGKTAVHWHHADKAKKHRLAPQVLADATEALVAALGLGVQVQADDGWRHLPVPVPVPVPVPDDAVATPNGEEQVAVLSTHFLELGQRAQRAVPAAAEALPPAYEAVVAALRTSLVTHADRVMVRTPGRADTPACLGRVGTGTTAARNAFRFRADVPLPLPPAPVAGDVVAAAQDEKENGARAFAVIITIAIDDDVVLTAGGSVLAHDGPAAYWPVHVVRLRGVGGAELAAVAPWHVGWLVVSCGRVDRALIERELPRWVAADRGLGNLGTGREKEAERGKKGKGKGRGGGKEVEVDFAARYAELLGDAVGRDVLASLVGAGGEK